MTGGNKGIGFEICRQLLGCDGVTVILTARDEQKGAEAVEKLRGFGLSDGVLFHQLNVADPSTVSSLFHFVKTNFGRLDILVSLVLYMLDYPTIFSLPILPQLSSSYTFKQFISNLYLNNLLFYVYKF